MNLDRWWPVFLGGQTQIRDRLIEDYSALDRGYHDLRHLDEVFNHLDELLPTDYFDRDPVLLAAWFHDAVYDDSDQAAEDGAGASNEERSALLAERELSTVRTPPHLVDEVARLVRLTETHRPADGDLNGQFLCDADLAILAAGPERYADYVAGVRREYSRFTDDEFAAGRRAVLTDLLAKPSLFHTAKARELWEETARANVTEELSR